MKFKLTHPLNPDRPIIVEAQDMEAAKSMYGSESKIETFEEMTKEQFEEELKDFTKWASHTPRHPASWYLSLETWAKMRYNTIKGK